VVFTVILFVAVYVVPFQSCLAETKLVEMHTEYSRNKELEIISVDSVCGAESEY